MGGGLPTACRAPQLSLCCRLAKPSDSGTVRLHCEDAVGDGVVLPVQLEHELQLLNMITACKCKRARRIPSRPSASAERTTTMPQLRSLQKRVDSILKQAADPDKHPYGYYMCFSMHLGLRLPGEAHKAGSILFWPNPILVMQAPTL